MKLKSDWTWIHRRAWKGLTWRPGRVFWIWQSSQLVLSKLNHVQLGLMPPSHTLTGTLRIYGAKNQFKDIIEGKKAFRNVIYWYIVRNTMHNILEKRYKCGDKMLQYTQNPCWLATKCQWGIFPCLFLYRFRSLFSTWIRFALNDKTLSSLSVVENESALCVVVLA